MLSEYFIDICIDACCATFPPHIRQQKELFSNISTIVEWYKIEVPEDNRPIEFKDKVDILLWLANYRKDNNFNFNIMMAKLEQWSLDSFIPILQERRSEYTEEKFLETYKMVLNRRKLCDVIKGKRELQQLLADIDNCTLTDDEEVINKWELQLIRAHDNLMNIKKIENIDAATSLDVANDSYDKMFHTMMQSVEESMILKTGYNYLQDMLVSGGFENRRLYLIGGSSGVGKSTMLINLICNAIKNNRPELASEECTYLYITAENLIDETWIRFYCCLTGESHYDVISCLKNTKYQSSLRQEDGQEEAEKILNALFLKLQSDVKKILGKYKSNVIFKYVPSGVTTTKDLHAIIYSVSRDYNMRAVFIDYLDLFTTGQKLELRFELGQIAQSFKNFAIDYNVPVITATQLNREGYNSNAEPKLTQMGESMEKVNKSDFVLFLQDPPTASKNYSDNNSKILYKQIRMTVLKQRNGKIGDSTNVLMVSTVGGRNVFNFRIIEHDNVKQTKLESQSRQVGQLVNFDNIPTKSIDYSAQSGNNI